MVSKEVNVVESQKMIADLFLIILILGYCIFLVNELYKAYRIRMDYGGSMAEHDIESKFIRGHYSPIRK